MKVLVLTLLAVAMGTSEAGRAFPLASENYIIGFFRRINPSINWDYTNFLVDLSGQSAICNQGDGTFTLTERTKDGSAIGGVRDSGFGPEYHVDAIDRYIRDIVDDWDTRYRTTIETATSFGCSVQPGCRGDTVVVACLFSPFKDSSGGQVSKPRGRAFTDDQYLLAEEVTGSEWDRSHLLENMAGLDIDCSMVKAYPFFFPKAKEEAGLRDMKVDALYGVAENRGSTQEGLKEVLTQFKKKPENRGIGCALIPDCIVEGKMWVVVNCIFDTTNI